MDKIAINLLPPELVNVKRTNANKSLLFKISIGVLVIMIGITATLLFVNLAQNQALSQANQQNAEAKQQLNSLAPQQSAIFSLKQRLGTVNSLTEASSAAVQSYDLISSLLPPTVSINTINIDKKNNLTLSVLAYDSASLETLINNLTDPNQNQGQISKATLSSLSQKGDLIYHAEIAVVMNASKK